MYYKREFESVDSFMGYLKFANERDRAINISMFEDTCKKFAFLSANDGNSYAVVETSEGSYAVVVTNALFYDVDLRLGDIVVFQRFDTVKQAIQCVFNTVIQDNNLDDEE